MNEYALEQRIFHKPNKKGTGQALKLHLRLFPKWVETDEGGYFENEANKAGGLFIEIAPQGPVTGKYAQFLWRDESQLVRAKLGVPDMSAMLLGIRHFRQLGLEVPAGVQNKQNPQGNVISMFHKNTKGTTILTYEFRDTDSIFTVSTSDGRKRSIAISQPEEYVLARYLELSLDAYLKVGKR